MDAKQCETTSSPRDQSASKTAFTIDELAHLPWSEACAGLPRTEEVRSSSLLTSTIEKHELGHAVALRGVPTILVTSTLRAAVHHPVLEPTRTRLVAFLERRQPPSVRVAFDLTLHRHGRLDRRLALGLIAGTTPGVILGVMPRSTWLASESAFAWVAATVLIGIGIRLAITRDPPPGDATRDDDQIVLPIWRLVAVGTIGGGIGGIYGLGGAALIVPYLVSIERLPIARVAGAGLLTTLVTSVIGLAAFAAHFDIGQAQPPDWAAGLAFGIGGALGAITGARLQPRIPVRLLRVGLGLLAIAAGLRTVL